MRPKIIAHRGASHLAPENTGKPVDVVERDTDRDNYLSADEALAYGLIDRVYEKR